MLFGRMALLQCFTNGDYDQGVDVVTDMGQRYICRNCSAQFMVTKGGKGEAKCCGIPLERK